MASVTSRFRAIRAACSPQYSEDAGSARCRLSPRLFSELNLKIGWIVHIALEIQSQDSSCTILSVVCTAWPDGLNMLPEGTICVDDIVVHSNGEALSEPPPVWSRCACEVLLYLLRLPMHKLKN